MDAWGQAHGAGDKVLMLGDARVSPTEAEPSGAAWRGGGGWRGSGSRGGGAARSVSCGRLPRRTPQGMQRPRAPSASTPMCAPTPAGGADQGAGHRAGCPPRAGQHPHAPVRGAAAGSPPPPAAAVWGARQAPRALKPWLPAACCGGLCALHPTWPGLLTRAPSPSCPPARSFSAVIEDGKLKVGACFPCARRAHALPAARGVPGPRPCLLQPRHSTAHLAPPLPPSPPPPHPDPEPGGGRRPDLQPVQPDHRPAQGLTW